MESLLELKVDACSIQVSDIHQSGINAWLETLFIPEQRLGRHAVICMSGF